VTDRGGTRLIHTIYKGELDDEKEVPKVIFKAIGPQSGLDGGSTIYDEDELILNSHTFSLWE
jgi:hypothetical protein